MKSLKHWVFYEAFKQLAQDIQTRLESLSSRERLKLSEGKGEWADVLALTSSSISRVRFMDQFLDELEDLDKLDEVTHRLVNRKWNTEWRTKKSITYSLIETPAIESAGGIISDKNMAELRKVELNRNLGC